MKIILIGFMGSGKSSVAKQLGFLLGFPIVEMDDLVCHQTNSANMYEVFAKGGELLLRETEIAIAKEYAFSPQGIVSTGAGVVMNKIVLDYLQQSNGKIFFLNTPFHTIKDRLIHDSSRPLFKNISEAESLYRLRQPLYLTYADHVIEAEHKSVKDIATEIIQYY